MKFFKIFFLMSASIFCSMQFALAMAEERDEGKFSLAPTIFPLPSISSLQPLTLYPEDEEFTRKHRTALTIAGSDPSGGAGIQADLKTFSALGCYGMSVITMLTAQNTTGVKAFHYPPKEFVEAQLEAIFGDIDVHAVKIGVLGSSDVTDLVADYLIKTAHPSRRIVVDPVMFAKNGELIAQKDAIEVLKKKIVPYATLLTPNIHEAYSLLEWPAISNEEDMEKAAQALLALGPQAVIVKGGALETTESRGHDCLAIKGHDQVYWFNTEGFDTVNTHGAGCTFSSAITSYLARGYDIFSSIRNAKEYISGAIKKGAKYKIGNGKGPVHHFHASWPPLSFTQEAWWEAKPIYDQIKQHPFIKGLTTGTLPKIVFNFYIQQDYLFLIDREKALSILASRTSDLDLAAYLTQLAISTRVGAEGIFEKYNLTPPVEEELQKSFACKNYTEYMLSMASKSSLKEGLTALLPCTLTYQKIGELLKPQSSAENEYQLWIGSYSSPERRQRVIKFIQTIDNLASQSSSEDLAMMNTVFQKASQYEYEFWEDAYYLKK